MKTLHYSLTIVSLMFVFFFTFYVENSHDAHATCVTINGTEECATPPPILTSIKSHYVPNETIQLVGFFRPNATIQIDLVDPNNNIKNSTLFQSDSSGSFQNKLVVPNDAVNGTWKINTSSGIIHNTQYITVISKNLRDNQTAQNGITSACCLLHGSNSTNILQAPLKQIKSGISPKDVTCNQGLQLIFKAEDNSPACVRSDTAQKLIERGWATNMSQPNPITGVKTNDPFGITALIIYHPPLSCLGPVSNATVNGCPPNNFYLKINSNSTAYLLGYNICDGESCTKSNDLSVLLPINILMKPDYQMIGLPVNLQWKYGDTVHIQVEASPNDENKTASLIDLGNSTIVP